MIRSSFLTSRTKLDPHGADGNGMYLGVQVVPPNNLHQVIPWADWSFQMHSDNFSRFTSGRYVRFNKDDRPFHLLFNRIFFQIANSVSELASQVLMRLNTARYIE
jgi:hypothetical protein